jgi:hypothetical protein
MGSLFLHNSNFCDFVKISKKIFSFVPSKCQNNKGNLFYYRSKFFLWIRLSSKEANELPSTFPINSIWSPWSTPKSPEISNSSNYYSFLHILSTTQKPRTNLKHEFEIFHRNFCNLESLAIKPGRESERNNGSQNR